MRRWTREVLRHECTASLSPSRVRVRVYVHAHVRAVRDERSADLSESRIFACSNFVSFTKWYCKSLCVTASAKCPRHKCKMMYTAV